MTGTEAARQDVDVKRALELIDRVRRAAIVPTPDGTRWRDVADDGRSCGIVFCRIADADVERSSSPRRRVAAGSFMAPARATG